MTRMIPETIRLKPFSGMRRRSLLPTAVPTRDSNPRDISGIKTLDIFAGKDLFFICTFNNPVREAFSMTVPFRIWRRKNAD